MNSYVRKHLWQPETAESRGGKYQGFQEENWSRRRESNPHAREGRQILSLLRLPVPPLRENCYENSMDKELGKVQRRGQLAEDCL